MRGRVITFTNLFPSAHFPNHGLFVRDRMRRVIAKTGLAWTVVCPVPRVPKLLRRGDYARHAAMPERETLDGVEVWHPAYPHWPGFSTAAQAARMAKAALPIVRELTAGGERAVLDAHYVYPDGVAALRIGERLGLPVLVTARGTDLNVLAGMPAVARQIRATAPQAFARVAVSEPLRRRFAEVAGVADDAVLLVRNGVDLERFRPVDPARARAELGLPAHGALVLGVGRLVRSKGFHLLARALHELPDARGVLVGDGPERAALLREAPPERLLLLGAQPPDRVALAYSACDVLVLPSEREGWPNVVTEALASGLPVVATAVGSVPQMLAEPHVGAAIPVGDAAALLAELRRFLQSPPDRQKIRAFATRFSWEEPVAVLAGLLERALV
jgi:glycosyltransferase involved in cell wall biosynthesis